MKREISLQSSRRLLVASLALTVAAAQPAFAASFAVNTQSDTNDLNPGDGLCANADAECSLRAAIEESNSLPEFPPAVISLPSGIYILTLSQLEIKTSLTINGAGSESTIIDGDRSVNDIAISPSNGDIIVNISGLTVKNGSVDIGNGAGIRVDKGASLFLANSVVSENQSDVGGVGITNSGSLTLFRTTVRDNLMNGNGGGVTGVGAGILNFSDLKLIESTVSNNIGVRGGGIANSGSLDVTNSTISGNRASIG